MISTSKISELEQKIFDKFFELFKHIYPPHFPNISLPDGKREKQGVGLYSLEKNSVIFILQLATSADVAIKIKNGKAHLENTDIRESFVYEIDTKTWHKFSQIRFFTEPSYSELLKIDLQEVLQDII